MEPRGCNRCHPREVSCDLSRMRFHEQLQNADNPIIIISSFTCGFYRRIKGMIIWYRNSILASLISVICCLIGVYGVNLLLADEPSGLVCVVIGVIGALAGKLISDNKAKKDSEKARKQAEAKINTRTGTSSAAASSYVGGTTSRPAESSGYSTGAAGSTSRPAGGDAYSSMGAGRTARPAGGSGYSTGSAGSMSHPAGGSLYSTMGADSTPRSTGGSLYSTMGTDGTHQSAGGGGTYSSSPGDGAAAGGGSSAFAFCPNCGAKLSGTANFCTSCGKPVTGAGSTASSPSASSGSDFFFEGQL